MSYNINSFVKRDEANALKEMIFQRVRTRSQSMNEDVQSDVMDIARDSFVSRNNPFSQIIEQAKETIIEESKAQSEAKNDKNDEIGFPQKPLKARALEQNRVVQEQVTASAIHNAMNEAHTSLTNKKSFMGALNFLNSQGAVSLMRTRADKFEAVV